MGFPVLIIGDSGVGKTYAIKNLDPEKTGIFLCEKSRLPFRKKFNTYLPGSQAPSLLLSWVCRLPQFSPVGWFLPPF